MRVLITGAAGFIGAHLMYEFRRTGIEVVGLDNWIGFYDQAVKHGRVESLLGPHTDTLWKVNLCDQSETQAAFRRFRPTHVVHLAAHAGVRASFDHPNEFANNNLMSFVNVLETSRAMEVDEFIYASSSSVYGLRDSGPFAETDRCDSPISVYAATKRSNELLAHSYSHLHGLPTTGLRLFTVYGPWGRPDMAPWLFSQAILTGNEIQLFNRGRQTRDFTFIDDAVSIVSDLVTGAFDCKTTILDAANSPSNAVPAKLLNIGSSRPVQLFDFVASLERHLGRKANLRLLPAQPGDVKQTHADTSILFERLGRRPETELESGIGQWATWFSQYFRV